MEGFRGRRSHSDLPRDAKATRPVHGLHGIAADASPSRAPPSGPAASYRGLAVTIPYA
jgi:hypothetical protein